ncbi:GH1 family beta-glucosidase [Alteromonas sp. a30]|uniref:GH1 family beta-glucosidase n=1 Tax=Alteromonas sp. a30 TaxID=2730917 RepID=UPI00227E267B|nr:GH1 family beta-glucosidase [Alteromonas sp. a30]MCY7294791.1 beta-glucosidase [Alteromonas sp. a30]
MKKITLPEHSKLLDKSFLFGVATSSFQIEGARDSRLKSIWDTFCETPGKIIDKSNGLVACEHIERWLEDIDLIQSLGVDTYRFSISWPRVMHEDGSLNHEGLGFYIQLLDTLNARGIKPFVTLYHWDLPQFIEDNGGWLNRETAYLFQDYVDKVSLFFGDRVHSYATFNEPFCSAYLGYEIGVHAPGKTGVKSGRQAAHHILLAHGLAMQVLQKNSPSSLNGIVLNFTPCYPADDSESSLKAADYANQYINHWYIKPLLHGEYPAMLAELPDDQKPDIEANDLQIMAQPLDFLGVNFYTRLTYSAPTVTDFSDPEKSPFYTEHAHLHPQTDIGWEIYPQALTDLLTKILSDYNLPPIYITENGAAMADELVDGAVHDNSRIDYYQSHLLAVHEAAEQGVQIDGYFAWSLMDNFEWAEGYLKRFGLVYVDYQTQQRILKDSALAYQAFLLSRTHNDNHVNK